jgi:hypothetical protein
MLELDECPKHIHNIFLYIKKGEPGNLQRCGTCLLHASTGESNSYDYSSLQNMVKKERKTSFTNLQHQIIDRRPYGISYLHKKGTICEIKPLIKTSSQISLEKRSCDIVMV